MDRGIVVKVDIGCIRSLPAHLLDFPANAVPCCLADVLPVDGQWCCDALEFFAGGSICYPTHTVLCSLVLYPSLATHSLSSSRFLSTVMLYTEKQCACFVML